MFRKKTTNQLESEITTLYQYLLDRRPAKEELYNFVGHAQSSNLSKHQIIQQILLSAESLRICKEHAIDVHLYYIHNARVKMVMSLLPAAKIILDLGGANGSVHDMGYPYPFDRLTIVDLPSLERCDMYKDIQIKNPRRKQRGIKTMFI